MSKKTDQKQAAPQVTPDVLRAVAETLGEITKLAKSMGDADLAKDDKEEMPQDAGAPPAPPADPAPPAPEGEAEDPLAEMASHMSTMSDEDLQKVIDALMAEMNKRKSAPAPEAPAPDAANQALMKSIQALNSRFDKIEAQLAKSTAAAPTVSAPKASVPSAAASNAHEVKVLDKNQPQIVAKLNKSEASKFLLSEQRNGNKKVGPETFTALRRCQSDEELNQFYEQLGKQGIKIP